MEGPITYHKIGSRSSWAFQGSYMTDCGRGPLRHVLAITEANNRSRSTRQERWLMSAQRSDFESRCSEHTSVFISNASGFCRLRAEAIPKSTSRLDHHSRETDCSSRYSHIDGIPWKLALRLIFDIAGVLLQDTYAVCPGVRKMIGVNARHSTSLRMPVCHPVERRG